MSRSLDQVPALSPALQSTNPVAWVTVFGPGAIIASLTIGTGELVFSSRAGVIFSYDILWLFFATCILKWALVFASGRHMVLSGAHPFQRYTQLPGPRAWFPIIMLIIAVGTFPVWMAFLSGVLGTLGENYTGIDSHLWAAAAVIILGALWLTGGYDRVEHVQTVIVLALLLAVAVSMVMLNPEWVEILKGIFVPTALSYPEWLPEEPAIQEALRDRPVWLETTNYVGVIGGSGFDYLCYVSFMRNKAWGMTKGPALGPAEIEAAPEERRKLLRSWLRAPLIDATVSFSIVFIFTVVFVASGKMVLGHPEHRMIPSQENLLQSQSEFVTNMHPWLEYLYIAGAILAMVGTIYGLFELVPALIAEATNAIRGRPAPKVSRRLRLGSALYVGLSGLGIILWMFLHTQAGGGEEKPPALVAVITPANLFTGVLACSFICILNPWMDWKFLPRGFRMNPLLLILNGLGAIFFGILGIFAYWQLGEQSYSDWGGGWLGLGLFVAILAVGWIVALILPQPTTETTDEPEP